jgi:quercetin dioxygenase-like cupin family protein
MTEKAYEVVHLDELDRFPVDDEGLLWRPVRRRLGIAAFGTNAYTAEQGTERVVEEHHEQDGHEELYFVASGRATFVLGDEEIDAPAGTFVHAEPGTKRGAVATEPGTTVLVVGAKPGEPFHPMPWEANADVLPLFGEGRYAEAKVRLVEALEQYEVERGILVFNLACAEARLGEMDAALEHLAAALEERPDLRETARTDDDFAGLRDDPRFAELIGTG